MTGDRPGRTSRPGRVIAAIDARLRSSDKAVRAVLAVLGVALLGLLGTAAWTIVMEMRSDQASDPRPAYVKGVQEKIHHATQAALPGAQARKLPASLKVRIQLGPEGNLMSTRMLQSSGDADLDALTLKIIHSAAPFEPFSPEMRRAATMVELNSEFHFR